MAYKVFKLADMTEKDFEKNYGEEGLEFVGQYTNYEGDDWRELPDINDIIPNFNKKVNYTEMSDEGFYATRILYWCETLEDVLKALKTMSSKYIGGIDEPVFFDYKNKKYVFDTDEFEGNAIVFPISIKNELEDKYGLEFLEDEDTDVTSEDGAIRNLYQYTLEDASKHCNSDKRGFGFKGKVKDTKETFEFLNKLPDGYTVDDFLDDLEKKNYTGSFIDALRDIVEDKGEK